MMTGVRWGTLFLGCFILLGVLGNSRDAHAVCDTPDLLFVLDNSASMGFRQGLNWKAAVHALTTITNTYKGKLRFGLVYFNSTSGISYKIGYGTGSCVGDGVTTNCVSQLQAALARLKTGGGTNLIGAITTAQSHLTSVRNQDTAKARKRSVMFITDGSATCADKEVKKLYTDLGVKTYIVGFGTGISISCLKNMAKEGNTSIGRNGFYQATNANQLDAAVKAIADASNIESCNGLDDDCDGTADEGNPGGGDDCNVTNRQGECKKGKGKCSGGKVICVQTVTATAETCNGKDDDCDGDIDEDWSKKGKSCSVGKGECKRTSTYVCKSDGSGITCPTSPGSAKTETCNNKDDDCDGKTDQGLSRACKTACGDGQETCSKGTWINCSAPKPTTEVCDGKDNDCDGQTDEDWSKKGEACTVGTGACKKTGTLVCTSDATGVECSASAGAANPEVCDGQDNDCDGQVDENLEQDCRSTCGSGTKICNAGTWTTCTAPQPQPELCDGKDNDCDGKTDNNASCPPNSTCKDSRCVPTCENEKCAKGLKCVDGLCVGDPCRDVNCPKGESCVAGRCYQPCDLIKCESGFICSNGKCVKPDNTDGDMTQDSGPVTVEETSTDIPEETSTGSQHDSRSNEATAPPAGCDCSTSGNLPFLPFCLAFCFLLFGIRRR